jgi:hypothetical protein
MEQKKRIFFLRDGKIYSLKKSRLKIEKTVDKLGRVWYNNAEELSKLMKG